MPYDVERLLTRLIIKELRLAKDQELLKQQLAYFGKIARAPEGDARRALTFGPGPLRLATYRYVRGVGRPRHEWAAKLHKKSVTT